MTASVVQQHQFAQACRQSAIGKLLPDALYVHESAIASLASDLQDYEAQARVVISPQTPITLVKFNFSTVRITYLFYPDFDHDPHPALHSTVQVDLDTGTIKERDYRNTQNPPILHRKETFVTPDYPLYDQFCWLTQQEAQIGLLSESRGIGFQIAWEQRLRDRQLEIHHHALACSLSASAPLSSSPKPKIERHKAAIVRAKVSKPVRLAVEAEFFQPDTSYFDYGCGHGSDIDYIQQLGYASDGWDPHYRPKADLRSADIVNLGYVINVIEDPAERREALLNAWQLTQSVLIVAAQVLISDRSSGVIVYGDGIITSRNTFQKYYEQEELKAYIDQVLEVNAVPVALGIYFVFRDESQAESFRASRFHSRARAPQIRLKVNHFETYRTLLQPLMDFYTHRGRLPTGTERQEADWVPIIQQFGSLSRAFKVILQATDAQEWDAIAEKRRHDLLVYLALSHFGHRPKFKDLAPIVQLDIKSLFGSYQQACTAADLMLMSLGNPKTIEEHCRQSPIGQQRPNSLWIHQSALDELDPLLRLYEGCASRTIGRPEEATLIKFHISTPKITYLSVPTFDTEPHPPIQTSMQISLRDLQVRYRDYDTTDNPPLIFQKDQLILPDYPNYEKFVKLSQQERNWGLLDDMAAIYDRQGWEACLAAHGADLKGYRLVWRKDIDPHRKKQLQAQVRSRKSSPP